MILALFKHHISYIRTLTMGQRNMGVKVPSASPPLGPPYSPRAITAYIQLVPFSQGSQNRTCHKYVYSLARVHMK